MDLASFKHEYRCYLFGLPAPRITSVFKKVKSCADRNSILAEITAAKDAHFQEKLQRNKQSSSTASINSSDSSTRVENKTLDTNKILTSNGTSNTNETLNENVKQLKDLTSYDSNSTSSGSNIYSIPNGQNASHQSMISTSNESVCATTGCVPTSNESASTSNEKPKSLVIDSLVIPDEKCENQDNPRRTIPEPTREQLNEHWSENYDATCRDLDISPELLKKVLFEKRMNILAKETRNGKKTASPRAIECRVQKLYSVLDDVLLLQEYNSQKYNAIRFLSSIDV